VLSDHSRPPDRRKKRFPIIALWIVFRREKNISLPFYCYHHKQAHPTPASPVHYYIKLHSVALISSCCPGNHFVAINAAARGRRIASLLNSEDSAVGSTFDIRQSTGKQTRVKN